MPLKIQDELSQYQAQKIVDTLGIGWNDTFESGPEREDALIQIKKLYKAFISMDCTLLEVNPWAVVKGLDSYGFEQQARMSVLNTNITIDQSALWRQNDIVKYREHLDFKMGNEINPEYMAMHKGINYVHVKGGGNIGCMINGAGLAMAVNDLMVKKDGQIANFMDIGSKVGKDEINFGYQLLAHNKDIDVIFVNIFGGIVDCEEIAEGFLGAINEIQKRAKMRKSSIEYKMRTHFPYELDGELPAMVIRLSGTNSQEAIELIEEYAREHSELDIECVQDLDLAAQLAVEKASARKNSGTDQK
jgi:succinyl-CoA synthetase beta subunit